MRSRCTLCVLYVVIILIVERGDARIPPSGLSSSLEGLDRDDSNSIDEFDSQGEPELEFQSYPTQSEIPITQTAPRPILSEWWKQHIAPHLSALPSMQFHWEPTTTLKLQKTFRPLGITILKLGASYHTHAGVWKYESTWQDPLIGGQLTLLGFRELQLSKSWPLYPVPGDTEHVTRLRFRASVDLHTGRSTFRMGLRSERSRAWNALTDGYTLLQQIPLDKNQHLSLQVQANVKLPEPEIEYSTERSDGGRRSLVGMGDVHVTIQELNVLLDY